MPAALRGSWLPLTLMHEPTCWISFWRPTICLNLILLMVSVERVRLPDRAAGPEVAAKPCVPTRLCLRPRRPLALSAWVPPSVLRRGATLYTSTGYSLPFTCRHDACHDTGLMVTASMCYVGCHQTGHESHSMVEHGKRCSTRILRLVLSASQQQQQ